MITSFHILSNLFIHCCPSYGTAYTEFLTALLNKLNKGKILDDWKASFESTVQAFSQRNRKISQKVLGEN
jgi:hypothetical protein